MRFHVEEGSESGVQGNPAVADSTLPLPCCTYEFVTSRSSSEQLMCYKVLRASTQLRRLPVLLKDAAVFADLIN